VILLKMEDLTMRYIAKYFCVVLMCGASVSANANVTALDFELASDVGFVRLSSLEPRVSLINFWRSDCPPCVRELPLLAELAGPGAIRVVTISLQRQSETFGAADAVQHALRAPVISLHTPIDARGLLARFGNHLGAVPHTVLLNAKREVCAIKHGEIDRQWLEQVVASCNKTPNHSAR
jgi:thiol-disulfide isomerase/thioredoxin